MRQTILAILLIAVILVTGFVWYRYIRKPATETEAPSAGIQDEQLEQYRQIENLKPDVSILSDPLFRALERAKAVPPPAATSGRQNPFAPF